MTEYRTEQERFWAGSFGQEYIERNQGETLHDSNIKLFKKIFASAGSINSVLEFGANIGMNLSAIKQLFPKAEMSALEINSAAVKALDKLGCDKVYAQSIFDFTPDYPRDFVFTKGVLIHLSPDRLHEAYRIIYESSSKYICLVEYYNLHPVSIPYRNETDKLFKRDFCGELMDMYADLKLIDYGFCYHRDKTFIPEDINWFLLEKPAR